jgi:stage V sporulation protein D (sporulation-specific penicillin-binding protein)
MAQGPNKSMLTRMTVVMACIILIGFAVLIYRLISLQFLQVEGKTLQQMAINQQLRDTPISAKRGTIYDRNMKPLAQSASVFTVYISPVYIKDETQRNLVADQLSQILNVDRKMIYDKACKKDYYEVIKRKIEKPEADIVTKFIADKNIDCVYLAEDSKRYYSFGNFAASILGFTGTDNQGLCGIEAYYDSYLKGVPGLVVAAKNAKGTDMPFAYQKYVDAKDGTNLVLTIDEVVQHFLEKNLSLAVTQEKVAKRGAGIVMDIQTGEILAMATEPDFDPNTPFVITDPNALARLQGLTGDALKNATSAEQSDMWRNKAISDLYEPGSVFKPITVSSALDEGAVNLTEHFNCNGSWIVSGIKIGCWKHDGHGSETVELGVINSCNPVMMQVAAKLGATNFLKYFTAYGFTQKTGIDLPGEADSIYHPLTGPNGLGPVELASSSFGQTFKVTPIQMITAFASVVNGGKLFQPRLVKQMVDNDGNIVKSYEPVVKRQVISKETSALLCDMLGKVVSIGTGKNAYLQGYRIGGKTGTSEKIDEKDQYGNITKVVASFMGFAPTDDPRIVVFIMLDEPGGDVRGGGAIAAPVVKDIMSEVLPYIGVEPVYSQEELAKLDISTPKLLDLLPSEADSMVKKLGLKSKIIGSGNVVISQIPAPGASIPRNGTVVIYTDVSQASSKVPVPNVIGLTAAAANNAITNAGLNIKIQGVDVNVAGIKAYMQSMAEGTMVAPGTVIVVDFRQELGGKELYN